MATNTEQNQPALSGTPAILLAVVIAVGLICVLVVGVTVSRARATRPAQLAALPTISVLHTSFGDTRQTVALDEPHLDHHITFGESALGRIGLLAPRPTPSPPRRQNLMIGDTPMLWSGGGYLYFHLLSNAGQPQWQFAPCVKTNLSAISVQDFAINFVSLNDKTNGLAAFGTDWTPHGNAVRVHENEIILARPTADPLRIYALQIVTQNLTRAVVRYIENRP